MYIPGFLVKNYPENCMFIHVCFSKTPIFTSLNLHPDPNPHPLHPLPPNQWQGSQDEASRSGASRDASKRRWRMDVRCERLAFRAVQRCNAPLDLSFSGMFAHRNRTFSYVIQRKIRKIWLDNEADLEARPNKPPSVDTKHYGETRKLLVNIGIATHQEWWCTFKWIALEMGSKMRTLINKHAAATTKQDV